MHSIIQNIEPINLCECCEKGCLLMVNFLSLKLSLGWVNLKILTFKHSLMWVYTVGSTVVFKPLFHIKNCASQFFLAKLYNLCMLQVCLIVLCCCFSDFNSLSSLDTAKNSQLAFDVARTELGISPVMTGQEMATCSAPDKLTMVSYLSQFYHKFHRERNPSGRGTGRVTDKCCLLYFWCRALLRLP